MRVNATALMEPSRFETIGIDVPQIGRDEAMLKVLACGICGTDIEQRRGEYFRGPYIPGHEPVGLIEDIGPDAAANWNVAIGDFVAVEAVISCGQCAMCRTGRVPCEGKNNAYGFTPMAESAGPMGGYSEYMRLVPRAKLHKFRSPIHPSVATLYNPLGAGVAWAVKAGELKLGDTVVIQGAGQRGLMCLVAARMAGAGRVIMTEVAASSWKLDLARRFGADDVIIADRDDPAEAVLEMTRGIGVDVVLDVSGTSPQPVLAALDMVRAGGTIVLGAIKARREIPGFVSDKLIFKGATIRGVRAVDSDSFGKAVDIIDSGRFPLAELHSHSLGLKDVDRAISLLAGEISGEQAFHVAIEPHLT